MPPQNNTGLIRLGILALPLAGLLSLVGALGGLSGPDPDVDPRGAAQAVSTTGYFLSQFVGNVLGVTLAIFGVIALFTHLANPRVGRMASWVMVLCILGFGLLLSFLGLPTYAIPAIGQEYLNGQQNAIQIADAIFGGTLFVIISLSSFTVFRRLRSLRRRHLALRNVTQMGRGSSGRHRPAPRRAGESTVR